MLRVLKPRRRWLSTVTAAAEAGQRRKYLDGVTIVDSPKSASRVLQKLYSLPKHIPHACDTEVAHINVKKQSPVGHGEVICFSIYCGPDVDFGEGSILWVDTLFNHNSEAEGEQDWKIRRANGEKILQLFKPYFEDTGIRKVWHHYAFDKHVLGNHGIQCNGFAGDTLHMARLYDSSRKSYSLQSLTEDLLDSAKKTMAQRFGKMNVKKDGTEGKILVVPDVLQLHLNSSFREEWIEYSSDDAKLTWELYVKLESYLRNMDWHGNGTTMLDFYHQYYLKFGELLTEIEKYGFYIDLPALKQMEQQARNDLVRLETEFRAWAMSKCADAKYMNITSDPQKQQLLFAPKSPEDTNAIKRTGLEHSRTFETENTDGFIEPGKKLAKKKLPFVLTGLGIPSKIKSEKGKPSVNAVSIRELCGYPRHPKYPTFGTAYEHFGKGEDGERTCLALDSLLQHGSITTLLETFIIPLQGHVDASSRIHCSLNINTETGRLSSRNPNLQNQPALEKDLYKIRNSFAAAPGKKLVVCDYSQLELRILAHLSSCKAMIDAFETGGDLHSRTAVAMFPYISEEVASGLLRVEEGDGRDERLPLVKDKYGSERRKAKMLNFSIAYGKTYKGLAQDWKVSDEEAKALLHRWYQDRPEVLQWQQTRIRAAREEGYAITLMGRRRRLPDMASPNISLRRHAERCAINTPIQGSAADIVMKAMLVIADHPRIQELGWKMVLQIHDEIILEGPENSAEEALQLIRQCMEHPFSKPLLVTLEVSGGIAQTWYQAK